MYETLSHISRRLDTIGNQLVMRDGLFSIGDKCFILGYQKNRICYMSMQGGQASSKLYNTLLKEFKQQWFGASELKVVMRNRKLNKI